MSEKWQDEAIVDIHREMMHLTSSIIAKSALGSDIVDVESDSVNNALFDEYGISYHFLMPFGEVIGKIPILPINKNFSSAKNTLDSIVYRMIKEHRAHSRKENNHRGYDLLHAY
jgi:hypothetical protein